MVGGNAGMGGAVTWRLRAGGGEAANGDLTSTGSWRASGSGSGRNNGWRGVGGRVGVGRWTLSYGEQVALDVLQPSLPSRHRCTPAAHAP